MLRSTPALGSTSYISKISSLNFPPSSFAIPFTCSPVGLSHFQMLSISIKDKDTSGNFFIFSYAGKERGRSKIMFSPLSSGDTIGKGIGTPSSSLTTPIWIFVFASTAFFKLCFNSSLISITYKIIF
ncbi:hypothetical protein HRbin19_01731 [bacterium HR19]|nr:hypothetical protein HRbin19_01731 [bacterium HR19]